jgi:uncharacterized membrane protein
MELLLSDRYGRARDDAMKSYVTVGLTVLAGAALLEAALVPGILIGGAAVLAPQYLPEKYLPKILRRRRQPSNAAAPRETQRAAKPVASRATALPAILPRFQLGQAIAKTITFRIIVTTLDFTTNYVVIGELATAAGLSSFNLVAGPLFYLGHEAVWNYFSQSEDAIKLPSVAASDADRVGLRISRTLAKTITFRTIASAVDFTVNYIVVGELAAAFALSATGLILGPFVYFGHEKAWEYFTSDAPVLDLAAESHLLPAPG